MLKLFKRLIASVAHDLAQVSPTTLNAILGGL